MKASRGSMLGAGMSNSSFKYSRLAADEDGYIDLQVKPPFIEYYFVLEWSNLKLPLFDFLYSVQPNLYSLRKARQKSRIKPSRWPYSCFWSAPCWYCSELCFCRESSRLRWVWSLWLKQSVSSLRLESLILDYSVHILLSWQAYYQTPHVHPPCGFKTANNLTDLFSEAFLFFYLCGISPATTRSSHLKLNECFDICVSLYTQTPVDEDNCDINGGFNLHG